MPERARVAFKECTEGAAAAAQKEAEARKAAADAALKAAPAELRRLTVPELRRRCEDAGIVLKAALLKGELITRLVSRGYATGAGGGAAASGAASGAGAAAAAAAAPAAPTHAPVLAQVVGGAARKAANGAGAAAAAPTAPTRPSVLAQAALLRPKSAAEAAAPFIAHATARIEELRAALHRDCAVRVVVAGSRRRPSLGTGLAIQQWRDEYGTLGDAARRLFIDALTHAFDVLSAAFADRVVYACVSGGAASASCYQVWGANARNWCGEDGKRIIGEGQARSMGKHGPGVFGIITTPVAGTPPAPVAPQLPEPTVGSADHEADRADAMDGDEMHVEGQDGDGTLIEGEEDDEVATNGSQRPHTSLTWRQMLAQAQLVHCWTPPDGACAYWGAMLSNGSAFGQVVASDSFVRFPQPLVSPAAQAEVLVGLMRRLRARTVAWLSASAQRALLKHEPRFCPTFAQYAARQLETIPERKRLRDAVAMRALKPRTSGGCTPHSLCSLPHRSSPCVDRWAWRRVRTPPTRRCWRWSRCAITSAHRPHPSSVWRCARRRARRRTRMCRQGRVPRLHVHGATLSSASARRCHSRPAPLVHAGAQQRTGRGAI